MKICPERHAADAINRMKDVVVIVPIDSDINETQHVTEKRRKHRAKGFQIRLVRRFHLEDHDCDDNRDHAIAERF